MVVLYLPKVTVCLHKFLHGLGAVLVHEIAANFLNNLYLYKHVTQDRKTMLKHFPICL